MIWLDLVAFGISFQLKKFKVLGEWVLGRYRYVGKAILVFIFGPNIKTRTLLRPRPKLNNIENLLPEVQCLLP